MVVLVLTAVPPGLRGHVTRWMLEIAPGVFVGRISARVRDFLWARVLDYCHEGRAVLIYPADNEQGMEFRTHRPKWRPTDFDGISLVMRPLSGEELAEPHLTEQPKSRTLSDAEVASRRRAIMQRHRRQS